MLGMQRVLSLIYPDQCLLCPEAVETSGGLCGACWRKMPFLRGLVCDACGTSLPGSEEDSGVICDDCLSMPRPWAKGRAALSYRDGARQMVLKLKHGDRPDLAKPAAAWLQAAAQTLLTPEMLLLPVPIHASRLLARRYNQSVEMSRALARRTGLEFCPDALIRTRSTVVQDGMGVDARFANVAGAIAPNPKRHGVMAGRKVCIVDDVMTSGATLSVASEACHEAGATQVCVLVLARVEKAP